MFLIIRQFSWLFVTFQVFKSVWSSKRLFFIESTHRNENSDFCFDATKFLKISQPSHLLKSEFSKRKLKLQNHATFGTNSSIYYIGNCEEWSVRSEAESSPSPNKLGSFVSRFCCCWDPDLSSQSPEVPAAWVPKGPERKIVCPTPGQITSCPPTTTKKYYPTLLLPSIS